MKKIVYLFMVIFICSCVTLSDKSQVNRKPYDLVIYETDNEIDLEPAYFIKYYTKRKKISILASDTITIAGDMEIFKIQSSRVHDIKND